MKTRLILLPLLAMAAVPVSALKQPKTEVKAVADAEGANQTETRDARIEIRTIAPNNRTSSDLTPVVQSDGSTIVDLQGRFGHALVAHISDDGTITYACADDQQTLEKVMNADQETVAVAMEEK